MNNANANVDIRLLPDLKAEIARLQAENEALRAQRSGKVTIKVHALGTVNEKGEPNKGNISVYGLGRFPVTLYRSQWERLLDAVPSIRQAIAAHANALASKD